MVTQPSPSTDFVVIYEGDALIEHTMDVRDLAPALLALEQTFDRANALLNGNRATVNLSIRATHPASFDVVLILTQLYKQAIGFLSGDLVSSATNLKELTLGGNGLLGTFSVVKFLKGKRPTQAKIDSVSENLVSLEIDNLKFTLNKDVLQLVNDPNTRKLLESVVRPLNRPGVDTLTFRDGGREVERIEKSDLPSFDVSQESISESTETIIPGQRLAIVAPNLYDKTGKWRLYDGRSTNWYGILDDGFLSEIFQRQRQVASGDLLVCDVRLTHRIAPPGNISVEHDVLKVLRYIQPGEQTQMFERQE